MSSLKNKGRALFAAAAFAIGGVASAGPIIIAGTDADDHGTVSGGVNLNGWEFMQRSFTSLGGAVGNGQTRIVCIGCNGGTASAAFASAVSLAGLVGFTQTTLTSNADIAGFFSGAGAVNVNNTAILYMPTVSSNVSGGITDAQLAIVNANGVAINTFVTAGGGLFTQEEANSAIGYGWLQALLPGFQVFGDNAGGVADPNTLQLTAQGIAQFPGLTNADISNATPWHAYFTGNLGALQTLVVGNGNNIGGFNDAVVIGGGFAGGGGTITPGVPEPETLALAGLGLVGLAFARRRGKKSS